jgi:RHH-type proline utilization regulon transcriptional repressor/proline dehydrogenase/delta 1-pyrroline-5-carboxylate dehydrogenase
MMPLQKQEGEPLIEPIKIQPLDSQIEVIGRRIFESSRLRLWDKNFWYTKLIELSTSDPRVKTQLFRFIDVLPVLKTFHQKRAHLIEYLQAPKDQSWPLSLRLVVALLKLPFFDRAIVKMADFQVRQMAKNFIVGRNAAEALPKVLSSRSKGLGFTLDILGETVFSEEEAASYLAQYSDLIRLMGDRGKTWMAHPVLDLSPLGPIPAVNISLKLSALDCRMDPAAFEDSVQRLMTKVAPLLRLAREKNVFINFDMETFALRGVMQEVFKRLILSDEFRAYRHFGIVIQAYQKTALEDAHQWIAVAKERGTPFTIRLVKGAYWDYEVIVADQSGWESPVFSRKPQSDASFERCAEALLDAYPVIELALGSHNVRSIAHTLAYADAKGIPRSALEFQMLYGMADPFKAALVAMGLRVREYDPVGEMLPGLSYLVRRLLENSANDSFLKQSFMDGTAIRDLLRSPAQFKEGET